MHIAVFAYKSYGYNVCYAVERLDLSYELNFLVQSCERFANGNLLITLVFYILLNLKTVCPIELNGKKFLLH